MGAIDRTDHTTRRSFEGAPHEIIIKIIVSCGRGAFKTASRGMVRLVHGTHPLTKYNHIDFNYESNKC